MCSGRTGDISDRGVSARGPEYTHLSTLDGEEVCGGLYAIYLPLGLLGGSGSFLIKDPAERRWERTALLSRVNRNMIFDCRRYAAKSAPRFRLPSCNLWAEARAEMARRLRRRWLAPRVALLLPAFLAESRIELLALLRLAGQAS